MRRGFSARARMKWGRGADRDAGAPCWEDNLRSGLAKLDVGEFLFPEAEAELILRQAQDD
jgi:hypothetical protein